jgi:hypothetical protein
MVLPLLFALFALADVPAPAPIALEAAAPLREPPLAAQDVNAAVRGSVFRLSTNFSGANERALHGTAFVVDKSGLLLTNFHVVRDGLLQNDDMKLSLEVGGQSVGVRVVAVDVVNDLALVRAARTFDTALTVALPGTVAEGEVVYSLGFPVNGQLTFVQGNYGGEKPVGFVQAGFAAMALNGGMSGGPMLNSHAEVIGVNRAMIKGAQELSYFSPLGAARDLLAKAGGRAVASIADWRSEAVAAVRRQEKLTFAGKIDPRREKLGGLSFLVPLPNQKCGQTRTEGSSGAADMLVCQSSSLTPILSESNALEVITMGLTSGSFYNQATRAIQNDVRNRYDRERSGIVNPHSKSDGEKKHELCGLRNVTNSHGVEMTISYCSLANGYYEGLFSTFVRVEVRGASNVTALGQVYQGLSAETTADFLDQFLESIQKEDGA